MATQKLWDNTYGHPHKSKRKIPMATLKLKESTYGDTEVIGKCLWPHRSYWIIPMAIHTGVIGKCLWLHRSYGIIPMAIHTEVIGKCLWPH